MKTHKIKAILGDADSEIRIDGKILQCSAVTIRAGANGYTNCVVEIPALTVAEMEGVVIPVLADMSLDEWYAIGREALAKNVQPLMETEGEVFEQSQDAQATFFRDLVQTLMEYKLQGGTNE